MAFLGVGFVGTQPPQDDFQCSCSVLAGGAADVNQPPKRQIMSLPANQKPSNQINQSRNQPSLNHTYSSQTPPNPTKTTKPASAHSCVDSTLLHLNGNTKSKALDFGLRVWGWSWELPKEPSRSTPNKGMEHKGVFQVAALQHTQPKRGSQFGYVSKCPKIRVPFVFLFQPTFPRKPQEEHLRPVTPKKL